VSAICFVSSYGAFASALAFPPLSLRRDHLPDLIELLRDLIGLG